MSQCICREIPAYDRIGSRSELDFYLDLVYRLAREKVIEITMDIGDNIDYAHIEMFCKHCGRKLKLVCEAYHGAGGYIGSRKYDKKRPKRKKT
ncbi:MAG: hypothetical protein NZ516_08345 [Raineya sp.]|nr:hypothetical protein [Raineya sp.]